MIIEEPQVMKELHEIRAKHYEESKHLSTEEYINQINEKGKEIMKKYNINSKDMQNN